MTLFNLFLVKALVYGILGYFVRSSLSATRGFDLGIAGLTVLSGYLFWGLSERLPHIILVVTFTVALTSFASYFWYLFLRILIRSHRAETYVLLAGLGLSGFATGVFGYLSGPGTRSVDALGDDAFNSVDSALLFCGLGLIIVVLLRLSRFGLQLDMLDRDRQFAIELGCAPANLMKPYGVILGLGISLLAISSLYINGTNPTSGLHQFLIAAAVAITFREFRLRYCLLAGCIFAGLETVTTYLISPSFGLLPAFALIVLSITLKSLVLERV